MTAPLRPTHFADSSLASDEQDDVIETTLFELVRAVDEVADTEEEVIATVVSLLVGGRVRLAGGREPRKPGPRAA